MIVYLHKSENGNYYLSNYKEFNENFTYITWVIKIDRKNISNSDFNDLINYNWIRYEP